LSKTEKVISLTGIDLLDFTGINEQKINFIREAFDDSVIIIRGDSLILKAEEKEIDTLTKVFEELMFLQKDRAV
jgi:ssDNA-specific exonuclease RecJ